MAIDPMFMDFGLNLAKNYISNRETDVANAGIALNNEIAEIQAAEAQGFAAVNYRQSLEEMQNASLDIAVQELAATSQARLESAVYGTSEEAQTLNIAREAGKSQAEIDEAQDYAQVQYKNQRKAIQAQKVSSTKIPLNKVSTVGTVLNAGADTYFQALKSGLIS